MASRGGGSESLLAALPMYDLPEVRAATDAFWQAISRRLREAGVAAPEALSRPSDLHRLWDDPALLFAQTCGYPLMTRHRDRLRVLVTPSYRAPGCEHGLYRSAVVVREGSGLANLHALRGRVCAINGEESHSGCNALRHLLAPIAGGRPMFAAIRASGGHRASLKAVRDGEADVAAVDAVTFELVVRNAPEEIAGLRVLAWTAPAPGLPYVCAVDRPEPESRAVLDALRAVMQDSALAPVREKLLLDGLVEAGTLDYRRILEMEHEAAELGYPRLS